jgi:ligand-binding sensor domain-containing protein
MIRRFTIFIAVLTILTAPSLAQEIEIITNLNEETGLSANEVCDLAPENDGWGVFIGTSSGLHVFLDYVYLPIFQKIKAEIIAPDAGGVIWTLSDIGYIYRVSYDGGIWMSERFAVPGGCDVTALAARDGTLYVGSDRGLFWIDDPKSGYNKILRDVSITSICPLSDGTIIVGIADKKTKKTGTKVIGGEIFGRTGWIDELDGKKVTIIIESEEEIIFGTESSGVVIMSDGGVTEIASSVKTKRINDILDDSGTIYVASDTGLFALDTNSSSLVPLNGPEGTFKTEVTSLSPAPGASIWVGTKQNGVYLVRYRKGK